MTYAFPVKRIHAVIDWRKYDDVEKIGDTWMFRGTAVPVVAAVSNLAAGLSIEDVADAFDLPDQRIVWLLDFVKGEAFSLLENGR